MRGLLFFFRVTLKASCPMDLHLYPLDVQECPLIIESCKLQFIVGSLSSEDDEGSKNVAKNGFASFQTLLRLFGPA